MGGQHAESRRRQLCAEQGSGPGAALGPGTILAARGAVWHRHVWVLSPGGLQGSVVPGVTRARGGEVRGRQKGFWFPRCFLMGLSVPKRCCESIG